MQNAKQEFLDHTAERCVGGRTIRCAEIKIWVGEYGDAPKIAILPVGYTTEDLALFLEKINVEYNSSYGSQELYGTIWYTDGVTWSKRGEYDGSEWWEFCEVPEITPELMGDKDSRI